MSKILKGQVSGELGQVWELHDPQPLLCQDTLDAGRFHRLCYEQNLMHSTILIFE